MRETVENLIGAIAQGNAIETEKAFAAAMAEKLVPMLDARRMEVAQNMFAQAQDAVVEEEVTEEQDLAMVVENATDDFEQDEISLSEEEVSELVEKAKVVAAIIKVD